LNSKLIIIIILNNAIHFISERAEREQGGSDPLRGWDESITHHPVELLDEAPRDESTRCLCAGQTEAKHSATQSTLLGDPSRVRTESLPIGLEPERRQQLLGGLHRTDVSVALGDHSTADMRRVEAQQGRHQLDPLEALRRPSSQEPTTATTATTTVANHVTNHYIRLTSNSNSNHQSAESNNKELL